MLLSIQEIKSAHTGHWFDRSTLAFFSSRISQRVYPSDRGTYFVSSEAMWPDPRRYSVRLARPILNASGEVIDCDISTVGEFQEYADRSTAHAEAARLAASGRL